MKFIKFIILIASLFAIGGAALFQLILMLPNLISSNRHFNQQAL
jgi:hypothetical protein